MPDPLDDLLSSCSLASRAIRLLTAETKRRAVLLRASCSEYELALDRLSLAQLHVLHQQDAQHQDNATAAATQETLTKANPDQHSGPGRSRSKAWCAAETVQRFDDASRTTAGQVSFQHPSAEVITVPNMVSIENVTSHQYQDSMYPCASEESSRITKSLEDILEQARSIRTSNSKDVGGSAISREKIRASGQAAAITTASASCDGRGGGGDGGRATAGSSRSGRGGSISASGSCAMEWASPGESNATPRAAKVPCVNSEAKAVGSVSSASQARRRFRADSLLSRSESSSGHPSCLNCIGATGKALPSTVAAHSLVRSSANYPGPRGRESVMSRSGSSKSRLSDSQSTAAQSGRSEHPGKQYQTGVVPVAAVWGSEVTENLESGLWDQIVRYETARRRCIGQNGIKGSSNSSTSCGYGAGKPWHGGFEAAEEALLHGLQENSLFPYNSGVTDGRDNARPDPHFLDLRHFLFSNASSESKPYLQREMYNQDRLGARSGTDSGYREGSTLGPEESSRWIEVERLHEIERLQRSLLMLLDELEGKRELLAQGKLQSKGNTAARQGGDERPMEGDGGGGTHGSLHEFEAWYCWNKVADVTGMLRECLDEMAHDNWSGGDMQSSVSKQAANLVEHPMLVLAGENRLHSLSQPHDDSRWRSTWQRSSGFRELRGTACLALVQELQARTSSCWPHDSGSTREHAAELSMQQLRTATALAAETDVARLVIPSLARELSHARLQERPPDQATSKPADHQVDVHQQDQQTAKKEVAQSRVSARHAQKVGVERLRERISKRPELSGKGAGGGSCDEEQRREEKELWAPTLAVFRAVDAVLSGGGRPRVSFVRRGAAYALGRR